MQPTTPDDNDVTLQNYQDELDTKNSKKDRATEEMTDDPTKILGIPPKEFKNELDKYDTEEVDRDDDTAEQIEDLDEDGELPNE